MALNNLEWLICNKTQTNKIIYIYIYIYIYIGRCPWCKGGARDVIVIVVGNGHDDTTSNPGRDCITHSTNTLGKGMNPIILPPTMAKIVGQIRFFSLGEVTSLGEGKL